MRGDGSEGESAIQSEGGAIPLLALSVGVSATIAEPAPGVEISRRLADLGFVPGTELQIVRRAPFGDPIEVEIRGYRLCLRARQVESLRVLARMSVAR